MDILGDIAAAIFLTAVFLLLVGFPLCEWGRSKIEKVIGPDTKNLTKSVWDDSPEWLDDFPG